MTTVASRRVGVKPIAVGNPVVRMAVAGTVAPVPLLRAVITTMSAYLNQGVRQIVLARNAAVMAAAAVVEDAPLVPVVNLTTHALRRTDVCPIVPGCSVVGMVVAAHAEAVDPANRVIQVGSALI
jgi:hypothetical protein